MKLIKALRRAIATSLMAFIGAFSGSAGAQDTVRYGAQIGAQYSLRIALQDLSGKYKLKYDFKDFRSGTENILALEQREVDVSTATSQHLLRAIEEHIPIVWVIGWGGGYNVLVARAEFNLAVGDYAGLKKLALDRAAAGRKLKIAAPTGSMQHLLILTAPQKCRDPARQRCRDRQHSVPDTSARNQERRSRSRGHARPLRRDVNHLGQGQALPSHVRRHVGQTGNRLFRP